MRPAITPLSAALAACLWLAGCGAPDANGLNEAPADVVAAATGSTDPDAALRDSETDPLDAILAGDWRAEGHAARDAWRHPRETLAFLEVGASQNLIEISPGGGWYAEILAPLARGKGTYTAVVTDAQAVSGDRAREYYTNTNLRLLDKFAERPDIYGDARVVEIDPAAPFFGAPGSADVVLTFRNVHNWVSDGNEAAMFQAFFDVLVPGGVLGVVEHRAAAGKGVDEVRESGYLPEDYVIGLATAAGFVLEEKSEVNANPADTKDHPNGVWTLPPSNRHDAGDAAKYAAIGESDRMTLRFRKPNG